LPQTKDVLSKEAFVEDRRATISILAFSEKTIGAGGQIRIEKLP
jgi:hypothetical protein